MITFQAPHQLEEKVNQYLRHMERVAKMALKNRFFLAPSDGQQSMAYLHENRSEENPFYKLGQIDFGTSFPDPTGKQAAYHLYFVGPSVPDDALIHTQLFVNLENPEIESNADNQSK